MKDQENDFQTINMIYKIKKIKKKQKLNNIKNIETLEILNNIPSKQDLTQEERSSGRNSNDAGTRNLDTSEYYAEPTFKNIKEGFKEGLINGLPDDNWEGMDDIISVEQDQAGFLLEKFEELINNIYITLITFNCLIAFIIVNNVKDSKDPTKIISENITWDYIKSIISIDSTFSGVYTDTSNLNNNPFTGENQNVDPNMIDNLNIVYGYICLFEAALSAYLFTFVWFYIIFYTYSEDINNITFLDYITRDNLTSQNSFVFKFLTFIFEYPIIILDYLRWFLFKVVPKYSTMVLNKSLCFLFLYIIIFTINYKYVSYIKNLLIDILNVNYTDYVIIIMCFIVAGEYINSSGVYSKLKSVKESGTGEADTSQKLSLLLDLVNLYLTTNAITLSISVITEILHIIIIAAFAVPIGTILCVGYFLYTSISFNLYMLYDVFYENKLCDTIIDFIRTDANNLNNENECNLPLTFWEELFNFLGNLSIYIPLFLFNFFPLIIFIIFSIYLIIHQSLNIVNDYNLQFLLQIISLLIFSSIVLIIMFFLYIYRNTLHNEYQQINVINWFILPPINDFKNNNKLSFIFMNIPFLIILVYMCKTMIFG